MSSLSLRASTILFCTTLAVWALFSGAAHAVPAFSLVVLSVIWAAFVVVPRAYGAPQPVATRNVMAFNCVFGLMLMATTLQLVPLPIGLVDLLSPRAAGIYRQNAALMDSTCDFAYLSVSRARTAYALCLLLGQTALFNAVACTFYNRKCMKAVTFCLFGAGAVLVVLEVIAHALPVWQTHGANQLLRFGPAINDNHVSIALAAIAVLALAHDLLKRHGQAPALSHVVHWSVWFITSATVFYLHSRGALMAWGLTHLMLAAFCFVRRRSSAPKRQRMLVIAGVAVICLLAVFSLPSLENSFTEYENTTLTFAAEDVVTQPTAHFEKTQLYADFANIVAAWFPAGFGRSAFEDAYLAHQSFSFPKVFNHAENEYLEPALEFGLLVWLTLVALTLVALVRLVKTFRRFHVDHTTLAIMLALCAILLQSYFDFGLRYWTVGYLATLLGGMICGRADYLQIRENQVRATSHKISASIGLGVTALAAVVACLNADLAFNGLTSRDLMTAFERGPITQNAAHELVWADGTPAQPALVALTTARAASPVVPKAVGTSLTLQAAKMPEHDYTRALPWLERATQLAPRDAETWLRLAKIHTALHRNDDAAHCLSRAFATDIVQPPRAASDLFEFPATVIQALDVDTAHANVLLPATQNLMAHAKFVEALELSKRAQKLGLNEQAQWIEFNLWQKLGDDDDARRIAQQQPLPPNSLISLNIVCDWDTAQKDFVHLLKTLSEAEQTLQNEAGYWSKRLFLTALYAPVEANYKHDIEKLLVRYRNIAPSTSTVKYELALSEAIMAHRLGEHEHATIAAQRALKYRPHDKLAKQILEQQP